MERHDDRVHGKHRGGYAVSWVAKDDRHGAKITRRTGGSAAGRPDPGMPIELAIFGGVPLGEAIKVLLRLADGAEGAARLGAGELSTGCLDPRPAVGGRRPSAVAAACARVTCTAAMASSSLPGRSLSSYWRLRVSRYEPPASW